MPEGRRPDSEEEDCAETARAEARMVAATVNFMMIGVIVVCG